MTIAQHHNPRFEMEHDAEQEKKKSMMAGMWKIKKLNIKKLKAAFENA